MGKIPAGSELSVSEATAFDGVLFDVVAPIVGNVGIYEDCRDRALRLAQAAINAFVGVDEDHVIAFVNTVHGTHGHTGFIFDSDARFSDDVRHMPFYYAEFAPRVSCWHQMAVSLLASYQHP